ncbi:glucose-6-phosphate isomerase [Prochlorococcus sp. MIT 1341]|uniref:glucose-6-phosphate isomerase n=1 Tax=Prochlorococcus sp. MIT 1341 TaxID=3096221 RepID=UPI002A74CA60|nr:glucose-6-phosphate isomerase [Prochlorococcus sp. MIT 1341]
MAFSASHDPETNSEWTRYCQLNWFNDDLGIWLDISRMHLDHRKLGIIEEDFPKILDSMNSLENGSISNIDEQRQVGHYWLRNASIAPNDEIKNSINGQISTIKEFSQKILEGTIKSFNNKNFSDVVWIGIGGSSLGPSLLINALGNSKQKLDFHFLDNIDPEGMCRVLSRIEAKIDSTLFVVVSKSGSTPEPKITMEAVREYVLSKGCNWTKHAIAITMPDSKLDKLAKAEDWLATFELQDWVGGRTSITSSVGLLPASLLGLDINEFLKGASSMDQLTRNPSYKDNPAALLSTSWYLAGEGKGKRDMVVLPYKDRLEVFSRYLQQLVMESLGKKNNRQGQVVHQGLAVYGNKGSTDQHAYVQQLRDGVDNFFVTFIEILDDIGEFNFVNGLNSGDHLSGFYQGTRQALTESGRQSITITMDKLNPFTLGALIALFERAVGFYAEMINVNAYDQPGVEAGKAAAADVLKLQGRIENLLSDCKPRSLSQIDKEIGENSIESIFIILRHLIYNRPEYKTIGEFNNPNELKFLKCS